MTFATGLLVVLLLLPLAVAGGFAIWAGVILWAFLRAGPAG